MKHTTASFLLDVVNSITLQPGAPNFDQIVAHIQDAQKELATILATPEPKTK